MRLSKNDRVALVGVILVMYAGTAIHWAIAPGMLGLALCWFGANGTLFPETDLTETPQEKETE